jgi:hypothetical protein
MSEDNIVTIGGEAIVLPPILNFAGLKRAWPAMRASGATTDSTDRVSADIAVIAAALLPTRPDLTIPEIEKRLRINRFDGTDERPGIMDAVTRLMIASGLVSQGEMEEAAKKALEELPPPASPAATETTEAT